VNDLEALPIAGGERAPIVVQADDARPPFRPVPLRALFLSLGSLTVPVAWALVFPESAGEEVGLLVWLTALIPAFLLTYYRGWNGASLALAGGMAVLSSTQVFLLLAGLSTPNWNLLFVVVLLYIAISMGIGLLGELLHRERWAVERLALTDPLTGLPNRRHASIFLDAAFASAERGSDLAVVLFDVDRFKGYNDRYGHDAGDKALRILGEIFRQETRTMDVTARWGGEEFLSILPRSDAAGAENFAERVRTALVNARERFREPVTLSAGIAQHVPGMESPELLVAAADQALYHGKRGGRDEIRVAHDVTSSQRRPPAPPPEEAEGWSPDASAEAVGLSGPREHGSEEILVVEENEDVRRTIVRTLRARGYRVHEAKDGAEALELLEERTRGFDLVITDLLLPGMSGFTLVDRIGAEQSHVRVLYLSGHSLKDVSWEGAPGTRTDFLRKPVDTGELGARVRNLLDQPTSVSESW